jgi:hypothetical protein
MISNSLFEKYKNVEVRSDGTLFGIDWDAVRKTNRCPLCGSKLYDSRKYPDSILCRSKSHRFFKIKKLPNNFRP